MNIEDIDRWCDRFEERLKAGDDVSVVSFLDEHRLPSDGQLLTELRRVAKEFALAVNSQAADTAVHEQAGSLLDLSATAVAEAHASTTIANYKLLQEIGQGGMGQVYLAEQQQPVKRRVALKIIKTETPTKEILARFEAERQALAMMDHHNIAKVLDAGVTDEGLPYFAMELVNGIPITTFCDKHRLSLNARLDLLVQASRAIQHAHQKGIIHRDVKPSNVLVTLHDGKPVAKVIDFGLAKALQEQTQLTDKTLFTQFGRAVGTPLYMSPEQAELNTLDVDTRTDVYSLGVLLYELLTGSTPLEKAAIKGLGSLQVLQLVRESEPPRPSSRLAASGDALTIISERRQIAPTKLQKILRGELDWIVMKALAKDRNLRFATANELASDVERYLNNEPVTARPPSIFYQARKFFSKHKPSVGTAATVAVLLVIGVIFLFRSEIRRTRAEENAKKLGAIEVTDPSLLHVRRLPGELSCYEHRWRFFVPADKSFEIQLNIGPQPPQESFLRGRLPDSTALPFVSLPIHHTAREVVVLLQFHNDQLFTDWQLQNGQPELTEEVRSKWALRHGVIDPIHPSHSRVSISVDLLKSHPYPLFSAPRRFTSRVFWEPSGILVLQPNSAYLPLYWTAEYHVPVGVHGAQAVKEHRIETGYSFWIKETDEPVYRRHQAR